MNGLPLWVAIFVTGLVIGVMYPDSKSAESAAASDSSVQETPAAEVSSIQFTEPFQVVEERGDIDDEGVVGELIDRLSVLESRVALLEQGVFENQETRQAPAVELNGRPTPAQSPVEQSSALAAAGFEQSRAAEIVRLHNQHQLERLEIRDRATREGWQDTAEFRNALREVGDRASRVRAELSDVEYDRYLYALGLSNRVALATIIPQGEAELAGLLPGDVITAYAGNRVFRLNELQAATSAGERGELVSIEVLRDGESVELYVPRGPLGVTISAQVTAPPE